MRIAIIGTGAVGSALAHGLKGKGHQVMLGHGTWTRPELSPSPATPARNRCRKVLQPLLRTWSFWPCRGARRKMR